MATEECKAGSKESQVSTQCKRLAELSTELHSGLQGLEKRLEPVLTSTSPKPETGKEAESLCPLAGTLRQIADSLNAQIVDVRTLTDRIEV